MKKRTLRILLKASIPVAVVLFVLAVLDYALWDAAYVLPLFIAATLFLAWLIVLLMWRAGSAHQRVETEPEYPGITVYPRKHG